MARRRYQIFGGIFAVLAAGVIALGIALSHDSPCTESPPLAGNAQRMKAIVYRCYGSSDVLKYEDIEKPAAADDEVLVKVHAAAVNPLDWHYMRGEPYVMRLDAGMGAPESPRMGVDFAGTVEAVGKDVREFKPGDQVFGGRNGAFAEYVTVRESRNILLKPENVTFEQAASVPVAAITALQALRDKGRIRAGQKILINGASGGVGTFAVQIAKSFGADVTGVCSTRNVEMVRSLGADNVIDYKQDDYTKGAQRYDLIVDMVGNHSLSENRRVMNEKGIYVMVGGPKGGRWIGPMAGPVKELLYSPFVSQDFVMVLAELNKNDLRLLRDMMKEGKLTSVIDKRYPLSEAPAAIAYVEDGHARGKVILTVVPEG